VRDAEGRRLAKRTGGLAIRDLRTRGFSPAEVLSGPDTFFLPFATSPVQRSRLQGGGARLYPFNDD